MIVFFRQVDFLDQLLLFKISSVNRPLYLCLRTGSRPSRMSSNKGVCTPADLKVVLIQSAMVDLDGVQLYATATVFGHSYPTAFAILADKR